MITIKYIPALALIFVFTAISTFAQFLTNKRLLKNLNFDNNTIFVSLKSFTDNEILEKLHSNSEGYVYLNESLILTMDNPMFSHFVIRIPDDTPVLLYRNSTAFVKPCNHSSFYHQENEMLDYLLSVNFKQFKKIINKSI